MQLITVHGRTRCQFFKGAPTGAPCARSTERRRHSRHRQWRHPLGRRRAPSALDGIRRRRRHDRPRRLRRALDAGPHRRRISRPAAIPAPPSLDEQGAIAASTSRRCCRTTAPGSACATRASTSAGISKRAAARRDRQGLAQAAVHRARAAPHVLQRARALLRGNAAAGAGSMSNDRARARAARSCHVVRSSTTCCSAPCRIRSSCWRTTTASSTPTPRPKPSSRSAHGMLKRSRASTSARLRLARCWRWWIRCAGGLDRQRIRRRGRDARSSPAPQLVDVYGGPLPSSPASSC